MLYKPTRDRIIVKPNKPDKPEGKIILMDGEIPSEGVIVAIGPGRKDKHGKLIPMKLRVGETILYNKGAGMPLEDGLLLLEYNYLIAKDKLDQQSTT